MKDALPELVILVGGFSCYNPDIGLRAFPSADYMCIGESDLTVGSLVKQLVAGERPKDLPGVISRLIPRIGCSYRHRCSTISISSTSPVTSGLI